MLQSEPSVAKVHRFLAAPNPPGKNTASKSSGFTVERSAMFPREMRADSIMTFRVSDISAPDA